MNGKSFFGTIAPDLSKKQPLSWCASLFLLCMLLMLANPSAEGSVVHVGPQRNLKVHSQAAVIARDGDTIEIDTGDYVQDAAVWRASNLTIRGVAGKTKLLADGKVAENKAIWVIKGNDVTIENIEFNGARTISRNGAGIRQEGANLMVKNCVFRRNENGILAGPNKISNIVIINSEFDQNGHGDGYSHNLYIGAVKSLAIKNSYFHHANVGHQIKSRAAENIIERNRIEDGYGGRSSYLIDLSSGGVASIIENVLHQGVNTQNSTMIAYGAEELIHKLNFIEIRGNHFINDRLGDCRSIWLKPTGVATKIYDNYFENCTAVGPVCDTAGPVNHGEIHVDKPVNLSGCSKKPSFNEGEE